MERETEQATGATSTPTPIQVAPLPDLGDLVACADYVCTAWEHPDLNVTFDIHEGMRRLRKAVALAGTRMPALKLEPPKDGEISPAAARMDRLQRVQHEHDEIYHPDIACLRVAERMRHLCLHVMKYAGTFAAQGTHDVNFRRALVDLFIIAMSAANTLGIRLSKGMPDAADLKELGRALSGRLGDGDLHAGFVIAVTAANGRFAKACEAIDHVESHPIRQTMQEAVQALAEIALAMAAAIGMNLDGAALHRLDMIEQLSFRRHLDPRGPSALALAAEQAS